MLCSGLQMTNRINYNSSLHCFTQPWRWTDYHSETHKRAHTLQVHVYTLIKTLIILFVCFLHTPQVHEFQASVQAVVKGSGNLNASSVTVNIQTGGHWLTDLDGMKENDKGGGVTEEERDKLVEVRHVLFFFFSPIPRGHTGFTLWPS